MGADGAQLGTCAGAVVNVTHRGFGALNKPPQTVPKQGRPPCLWGEAEHGESSLSLAFPWAPQLEAELEFPGSVEQQLRWPRAVPVSLWPFPGPELLLAPAPCPGDIPPIPPALVTSFPCSRPRSGFLSR